MTPVKVAEVRLIRAIKSMLGAQPAARIPQHLELGKRGERLAREYLIQVGHYSIVATNVKVPLGRSRGGNRLYGEIDIVAYEGDKLVFVEVKTRSSDHVAAPQRNVDLRKQRQIARAARRYRRLMNVLDERYRFDVVTVVADEATPKIGLLRGYFDDRVFKRSRYFADEFF